MAQPRFRVGQRVHITRGNAFGGPTGFCSIVAALPREVGPQQYRVRSDGEQYDRIVEEARLEAVTYD